MSKIRDGRIPTPATRPTSWWLDMLRKRAATMYEEDPAPDGSPDQPGDQAIAFATHEERDACVRFFNAALRAEESGYAQAHQLAAEVRAWDPELAECLVLYGNEEGWHRELVEKFILRIGGEIRPMGRVTGTYYKLYAKAKTLETIMLTNLMFETIGSTTYRIALGRVTQPAARRMLTVLARDESFHVPLNVHFIREMLRHRPPTALGRIKLEAIYHLLFVTLVASSAASRRVAQSFDRIEFRELATAYAENLGRLFMRETDLHFVPPMAALRLLGIDRRRLDKGDHATSVEAAAVAARRESVEVNALVL